MRERRNIVSRPVKEPDRSLHHVGVVDIGSGTRRVERHVEGKVRARRRIHAVESLEARVERGHPAAGAAEKTDACRVDPRVLREQLERTIASMIPDSSLS